jgi:hypothetical protein
LKNFPSVSNSLVVEKKHHNYGISNASTNTTYLAEKKKLSNRTTSDDN